ncbi:helix-turn-helix domain-containing protein [Streptomyces sp. NPDC048304]|uniref:helix-turn-helix domain-containing protein n=1 Tax=Streptomyces sp. NPDC048304 TaxID=3154820 RepID=UPI0033F8A7A7
MNIQPVIAEHLRQGLNNSEIARRTGADRKTIARARQRLGVPNPAGRRPTPRPATAKERLFAEALPTGRVRDYRPRVEPLTPAQQAANRERLLAALRDAA